MTCILDQAPTDAAQSCKKSFWQAVVCFWARRKRPPKFDPRQVSDHMKRDLGYLDGRR